jgi:hypothetical protein
LLQRFDATTNAHAQTIENKLSKTGVVNVSDLFKSRRASKAETQSYLSEKEIRKLDRSNNKTPQNGEDNSNGQN